MYYNYLLFVFACRKVSCKYYEWFWLITAYRERFYKYSKYFGLIFTYERQIISITNTSDKYWQMGKKIISTTNTSDSLFTHRKEKTFTRGSIKTGPNYIHIYLSIYLHIGRIPRPMKMTYTTSYLFLLFCSGYWHGWFHVRPRLRGLLRAGRELRSLPRGPQHGEGRVVV